jgi:hypothetical protein
MEGKGGIIEGMPPINTNNTNQIVVWAVIATIVVGSLWYVFSSGSTGSGTGSLVATTTVATSTATQKKDTGSSPTSSVKSSSTVKPTTTSAKIVGTTPISYLFDLRQPLICSVKTTGTSVQRSGTMYVADGQMRADFINTSMIDDGTYLYVWANGATKGLKLLAASGASGSAIASNGGFDLVTPLSFACNPWTKDASVFVPPAPVSFSNSL